MIAIGNSGDGRSRPKPSGYLAIHLPARGAAVWTLARLLRRDRLAALAAAHRDAESEPLVETSGRQRLRPWPDDAHLFRARLLREALCRRPGARFDRIVGTSRTAEQAAALSRERFGGRLVEMLVFDGTSRTLADAIAQADALLVSAAPAEGRDRSSRPSKVRSHVPHGCAR